MSSRIFSISLVLRTHIAAAALILVPSASAVNFTWNGPTNVVGAWNDANNWDNTGIPNSFNDQATISSTANRTILLGQPTISINQVVMNSVGNSVTLGQSGEELIFGGANAYLGWYRQGSRVRTHVIAADLQLDANFAIGGQNVNSFLVTERQQSVEGVISGTGGLTVRLSAQDDQQDNEFLNIGLAGSAPNTYAGGTTLLGNSSGKQDTFRTRKNGALGTGDVLVNEFATLQLTNIGLLDDAISDLSDLYLTGIGGNFAKLDLLANVNETVNHLFIGNATDGWIPLATGNWGSTASGAQFTDDNYFSGTGFVTVLNQTVGAAVPEPTVVILGLMSLFSLARRGHRRDYGSRGA